MGCFHQAHMSTLCALLLLSCVPHTSGVGLHASSSETPIPANGGGLKTGASLDLSEATCQSFGWKNAQTSSHGKRRVIDAYAYNGETMVVKARHDELKDYINGTGIVITEANFKGEVKDPVEPPNVPDAHVASLAAEDFAKCGSMHTEGFNYCVLSLTKNSIATAVEKFELADDDWVLFSDPDEIPDREVLRLLHECEVPVGDQHNSDHIRLHAKGHYMYTFDCHFGKSNWRDDGCKTNCKGPVVIRAGTMRKHGLRTFQAQVKPWCVEKGPYATCAKHVQKTLLMNTAWHISSFGGPGMFSKKMADNSDAFHSQGKGTLDDMRTLAKKCIDLDDERKHPDMKLASIDHPMTYPWIPHSVADHANEYRCFFTWEA